MNYPISKVEVIAYTQPVEKTGITSIEHLITYCARASNPANRLSDDMRLLDYCMQHKHWSVFQMANVNLHIETPRDTARQFTRHSSLAIVEHEYAGQLHYSARADGIDLHAGGIQEFSQRYAEPELLSEREMRRQDHKNRQNSFDDIHEKDLEYLEGHVQSVLSSVECANQAFQQLDVAKECRRTILPEGFTMSTLFVNATVRSWLNYLEVRKGPETQKEHRELALLIEQELAKILPKIFKHG